MRLSKCLALLALSVGAAAQTPGIPGFNELSVPPLPPAPSCTPVVVPGVAPVVMTVSAAPGSMVFLAVTFCPCVPCAMPLPPEPCPIPMTACGGITNQSMDLLLGGGCPASFLAGFAPAGLGVFALAIPPGLPLPITFTIQGAATNPCAVFFGGLLVTQAYTVTVI